MTFDLDWPHGHVTRDGRKARIICRDLQSVHGPIVAAVMNYAGSGETVVTYYPDGKYIQRDTNSCDLLNVPAPKRRIQGWINVYQLPFEGPIYPRKTRADADNNAAPDRIACFYVDIEEGEGL